MLLEKNGRGSSGKRTRHINIRHFFVADRIASKEVKVEYCPTGDMLADFFTKPLQGTLFRKFRNIIMNCDPASTTGLEDRRSVLGTKNEPRSVVGRKNKEGETANVFWTIVGHRKEKIMRHRVLRKEILMKRRQ